jgi:hypothetical protein
MLLDEFVSESLKAIIKGITDAQEFAKSKDATINPIKRTAYSATHIEIGNGQHVVLSSVDFDVAVTAANKQESGLSAGISVFSLNLGGRKSDSQQNQIASRIKFNIEVLLPSYSPPNKFK